MRTEILQQATRLFAAQGYDGTPLQQIADAVGIRKPSLLYHFASKAELHRHVLEAMLAHFSDVLPRLMQAADRNERFDAVMEEMMSFFRADPDRARLLVREVLDRPEAMTDRLATFVQPWLEVIVGQLDKGKAQGLMHSDIDPEAYVVQVINLVVSGIALAGSLRALVPGASDAEERLQREILRVARTSLFSGARVAATR